MRRIRQDIRAIRVALTAIAVMLFLLLLALLPIGALMWSAITR